MSNLLKKISSAFFSTCWLLLLVFVLAACTKITDSPVPSMPQYIQANDDNYSCAGGQTILLTPLKNDSLRGNFTMTVLSVPHGSIKQTNDSIMYTSPVKFIGVDSIVYKLENTKTSRIGFILISINSNTINTVLRNDTIDLVEGSSLYFNPLMNDSLLANQYSVSLRALTSNGVTSNGNFGQNGFYFNSRYGNFGTDRFQYTLRYVNGESYLANVVIKVIPDVACAGTLAASADTVSTVVNSQLIVPYSFMKQNDRFCLNDVPDGNIIVDRVSSQGTLNFLNDGFTFTPNAGTQGQTVELNYSIKSERFPLLYSRSKVVIKIR
jgi:hypothetical protein